MTPLCVSHDALVQIQEMQDELWQCTRDTAAVLTASCAQTETANRLTVDEREKLLKVQVEI